MLGKRWFGFALTALLVCLTVYGVATTPIGILPAASVAPSYEPVAYDVDALVPELRAGFLNRIDDDLRRASPRDQKVMRLAFGNDWRSVIKRHSLERGWPVVRKHASVVLAEMARSKQDVRTADGARYFNDAMLQRQDEISEELRQLLKDSDVGVFGSI